MADSLHYTQVSGAEILRILSSMEKVLEGEPEDHIMMACLTLAIITQAPNITPEQLVSGVKSASEWVALFASSIERPVPKELAN